jgi:preprotein translocase subunit SecF
MEKLKEIWAKLSNKAKWVVGIVGFLIICSILSMFSTCGGDSKDKSATPVEEQKNEVKTLEAATLKLKGVNAALIEVNEDYTVSLVKTPEDDWQVRVKATFVKADEVDETAFQAKFKFPQVALVDAFDVEQKESSISGDDLDNLLLKEVDESEEITLNPCGYGHMSYDEAKKIYDAVSGVVISGLDLKEVEKEEVSAPSSSVSSYDVSDDVEDAVEEAKSNTKETLKSLKDKAVEKYEEVSENEDVKTAKEVLKTAKDIYDLVK